MVTTSEARLLADRVWSLVVRTYRSLEGTRVPKTRMSRMVGCRPHHIRTGRCDCRPQDLTYGQQQALLENLRSEATVLLSEDTHATPAQVIYCLSR